MLTHLQILHMFFLALAAIATNAWLVSVVASNEGLPRQLAKLALFVEMALFGLLSAIIGPQ